jgi:hypothetical protein
MADIRDLLNKGPVTRRQCRVCGEPISLVLNRRTGNPAVNSCVCRSGGERLLVELSWREAQQLYDDKPAGVA